ncbi:MAG: type V CRISPR-associated protein Cas12a/Cpf1 [Candidatus Paceibacterota bacterium]
MRFELKPIGKTQELIEANKVLEKDKLIDDNYHKIKYYLDLLHKKFIKEALSDISFDLKDYYKASQVLDKKDKKTRDTLRIEENKLRDILAVKYDLKANEWKEKYKANFDLKKEGIEILFEKDNLNILKAEFLVKPTNDSSAPDIEYLEPLTAEKVNLFDSFKGFTTYFSGFNQTRRNFYSKDDSTTAVANRVVNENLRRFCENIKLFEDKKSNYREIVITDGERQIFDINSYNQCLTQDGIDRYNEVIGRKAKDESVKGLNQKVNEYRQQTKIKLPFFKELYGQIMGGKELAFQEVVIESDGKLFDVLEEFIKLNDAKINESKELTNSFFEHNEDFDVEKIYLKRLAINSIKKIFGNSAPIFENALPHKETASREEKYKLEDFISIAQIRDVLLGKELDLPKKMKQLGIISQTMVAEELFNGADKKLIAENNYQTFLNAWREEFAARRSDYEIAKDAALEVIGSDKTFSKKENQIIKIKEYCDAALALYQMMKHFALEKGSKPVADIESDNDFYKKIDQYCFNYPIIAYYNAFRNFVTKKDYLGRLLFPGFNGERQEKDLRSKRVLDGAEKIKLNFDIAHDHDWGGLAILFRERSSYFIGIPVKGKKVKIKTNVADYSGDGYEMMEYIQLKFKTLVGKGYVSKFGAKYSEQPDLVAIKNAKELIAEKYLNKYPLLGNVLHRNYDSKKEFGNDIGELLDDSYALKFRAVNKDFVNKLNEGGDLYLFSIESKDFRVGSTGNSNLQTQYFNYLFDGKGEIKLNSAVELYMRPRNINLPVKKDKQNKEVIDHKRYAEDKYFLHISIILNFGKEKIGNNGGAIKSFGKKFNTTSNQWLIKNKDVNIIGIDRGEKNLAYYSIIGQDGKMIDGGSFNEIEVKDRNGNVIRTVDYADLLRKKAGNRDEARKNWKTIENIKELKNGYISQVVRKICDLILEHNAIVVFEDLNVGFKRTRSALDFPIYQKLELALVKKLNYLVNKNEKLDMAGHYLKAYQLAPLVANPKDIGKQTGVIYYTPAGYTSKTCPLCGFRKNNNEFYFESIEKAKKTLSKLESIGYDEVKKRFAVTYCFSDFQSDEEKTKAKKQKPNELYANQERKDKFTVYSDVLRYRWHNLKTERAMQVGCGEEIVADSKTARGLVKKYDINECLVGLFDGKIDYRGSDILNELAKKEFDKDFYKNLLHYLNLILEIRNCISDTKIDYIQCPVCGFHSDHPAEKLRLVTNGDANGAYNIARKGLLILEKIRRFKEDIEKIEWKDLSVGIEEWDKFTQKDSKK